MKTFEQIKRYLLYKSFTDEDWARVKQFMIDQYGKKIGRPSKCTQESSYDKLMNWIENGYGAGEIISYGNTSAVVCEDVGDCLLLMAYLSFDGRLIIKDKNHCLKVEGQNLIKISREDIGGKQRALLEELARQKKEISIASAAIIDMYQPNQYDFVVLEDFSKTNSDVGVFIRYEEDCVRLSYMERHGKLLSNRLEILNGRTLKKANMDDIQRFVKAANKAGMSYSERLHTMTKLMVKGKNSGYWYINEEFAVVKDIDNGKQKHKARFEAGNYFPDYAAALLIMRQINEIIGKVRS